MADAILFNVAASLLTKLGSSAIKKFQSLWGVDDELHKLKCTISAMKAVLLDAEEQQFNSNTVHDWISKVKDAFYEVDDLIDEYDYETLRCQVIAKGKRGAKEVRQAFSIPHQIVFQYKMSKKIKDIREKLEAIDVDKNQFNFSEYIRNTRDDELRKSRETSSFIYDDEVVGRDDDRKEIIDLLLNTDTNAKENIAVIAIVGMGGLGKTALAQSVYNNESITKHFELKVWTCISEEFVVKDIVKMIIESVTSKKPESDQIELLQKELRRHVNGKKYLLIMDDVWNEDHEKWVNLKRMLMGGAPGSKILITTRSHKVVETFDITSPYDLGVLDNKSAWLLFKRMAFGAEKSEKELENSNLVEIGKDIVVKLKGLPLAIRTIGRLLYAKEPKLHLWSAFRDKELSQVLGQREEAQFIRSILQLSYNHLQPSLKQCFLYCALFPKDYKIQKEEVIKQWLAQGFIQSDGMAKPNDIGEDYFKKLLSRSFFQDVSRNEMNEIIACKMHDLMHELACSIVKDEYVSMDENDKIIAKKSRHIFIYRWLDIKVKSLKLLCEAKNLRTLLIIGPRIHDCQNVLNLIPSMFLRLRTLSLNSFCRFDITLPESIGKLKHLRYLKIRLYGLLLLPNSLTELYNLETLIFDNCYELRELPRDAKNWTKLTYLSLTKSFWIKFLPNSLTDLYDLETLILDGCSQLQELPRDAKNWAKLRYLSLTENVEIKVLPKSITELYNLETLILDGCSHLQELPRDVKNWTKLKYLSLVKNERIKFLPDSIVALLNLETLILQNCSMLQELPKDIKKCVKLRHLDLHGCTSLTHVPKGLSELTSLQTMNLLVLKKDTGCDLSELNRLSKLKGSLTIKGLEFCTIDELKKNSFNLQSKLDIQKLELVWNYLENEPMNIALDNHCKGVLECLQPHSNVQNIYIHGYREVRLCDWLSSSTLVHLVSVELSNCFKLQALPQFDQFPFLKHLGLKSLPCIEYIDNNDYPSSSSMFFPSLEKLSIKDMHNLKGWWKGETSSESSSNSASFPSTMLCLYELKIDGCPQLASIPCLPPSQLLEMKTVSSQLLKMVIKMTASHCTEESSSTPHKLSIFIFENIEDLEFLPKELFYHFTNLENLAITNCRNLQMSYSINDVLWKEFRNLSNLWLIQIPKLEYLPNGIQHVTTLGYIQIEKCPNLIALPEWIGDLKSLQCLIIDDCPKLTSLPNGIYNLSSLQTLSLWDCPKLTERYKKGKGKDWPKISHISCVNIH